MELGWIDFSKTDRDKVLDVLDLLGEKGTLDELGIAPIRDAYSNFFFPGTSTLHNRAKSFFVVPFIMIHPQTQTMRLTNSCLEASWTSRHHLTTFRQLHEAHDRPPSSIVYLLGACTGVFC